jgi:secretion/DNA translocation related CpaE-like protein
MSLAPRAVAAEGGPMETRRPLLITDDTELTEEVLRLAAATGVDIHLAAHADSARAQWAIAPLVLIGVDRLAEFSQMPRRRDVVVIARELTGGSETPPVSDAVWRDAIAIGAEHVVSLPDAERWLIERLADSGEGPSRQGAVVCVLGACGGAGASTVATVMASAAQNQGRRTLLIDTDATGGGIDLLLGAEQAPGARWVDLAEARGRLSATTLNEALPHVDGLAVLSFGRQYAGPLNAEALTCVLDAGVRGYDLVVIDLVRSIDAIATIALGRATSAYVVVPNSIRAASAAASLLPALDFGGSLTLLMRKAPHGLTESDMQRALGQGFFATLPENSAIAASAEQGELPGPRNPFSRVCLEALQSALTQLSVA